MENSLYVIPIQYIFIWTLIQVLQILKGWHSVLVILATKYNMYHTHLMHSNQSMRQPLNKTYFLNTNQTKYSIYFT